MCAYVCLCVLYISIAHMTYSRDVTEYKYVIRMEQIVASKQIYSYKYVACVLIFVLFVGFFCFYILFLRKLDKGSQGIWL